MQSAGARNFQAATHKNDAMRQTPDEKNSDRAEYGSADPILFAMLSRQADQIDATHGLLSDLAKKIDIHINEEAATIQAAIKGGIAEFSSHAFPDGDAEDHRKCHERQNKKRDKLRDSVHNLVFEVIKWGAVTILGWLGYIVWTAFLKGPTP